MLVVGCTELLVGARAALTELAGASGCDVAGELLARGVRCVAVLVSRGEFPGDLALMQECRLKLCMGIGRFNLGGQAGNVCCARLHKRLGFSLLRLTPQIVQ